MSCAMVAPGNLAPLGASRFNYSGQKILASTNAKADPHGFWKWFEKGNAPAFQ